MRVLLVVVSLTVAYLDSKQEGSDTCKRAENTPPSLFSSFSCRHFLAETKLLPTSLQEVSDLFERVDSLCWRVFCRSSLFDQKKRGESARVLILAAGCWPFLCSCTFFRGLGLLAAPLLTLRKSRTCRCARRTGSERHKQVEKTHADIVL